MATTSIISLTNYCLNQSSTASTDMPMAGFPASNVLTQDRSRKWRGYDFSSWVQIDMHTPCHPDVFGLIESNFGTAAVGDCKGKITLQAWDSPNLDGQIKWTWDLQSNNSNRTWVKSLDYPDENASWASTVKKRVWRVTIQILNTTGTGVYAQPEIGVVWLGDLYELPFDSNFTIKVIDPGKTTPSYNGTDYLDSLRAYAESSITIPTLPEETALNLKTKLDTIGGAKNILIDIYAPDETDGRSLGTYYGFLDDKSTVSLSYKSNTIVDLKFKITESLA
jgi:hypothetical protein